MRLINTSTLRFENFLGTDKPPYAILSHTWGDEELTYQEFTEPSHDTCEKFGFQKIEKCCSIARDYGLSYAWVDTCCIDKRSSAELSEAINSMYRWYSDAQVCLAYMSDVDPVPAWAEANGSAEQVEAFRQSRWFLRAWTLQELIAPHYRVFFCNDWSVIDFSGTSTERNPMESLLESITGIGVDVLRHHTLLSRICVAERMSWAARRQATREEDMAYCLMGLFKISMPVLYGEGFRKAFRRLQEEIMRTSFDYSLFAWPSRYGETGFLAKSPADFDNIPKLGFWSPSMLSPFQMTNLGLCIRVNFNHKAQQEQDFANPPFWTRAALQIDIKTTQGWGVFVVRLRLVKGTFCIVNGRRCRAFRRVGSPTFEAANSDTFSGTPYEDILVLENEHLNLVQTAHEQHEERWGQTTQFMLQEPLYCDAPPLEPYII